METTTVFFRDDDVGACSPALRAVVEFLLREEIPCNYQVVPALLQPQTASYLRARRASHPGLVELNQHGHRHRRLDGDENVWGEFGGHRSYDEQWSEIQEGRVLLARFLGADFGASVFTPPCHKFDAATLRALRAIGVEVLSAGVRTSLPARIYYALGRSLRRSFLLGQKVSHHGRLLPGSGLAEVSVAIDVDEDTDRRGVRLEKSASELYGEFTRAQRLFPIVGVMLHHETYQSRRKLETLREFICMLKGDPRVVFRTIESIAAPILGTAPRCEPPRAPAGHAPAGSATPERPAGRSPAAGLRGPVGYNPPPRG